MNRVFWAHVSLFTLNLLYAISYFVVKKVSPTYLDASGFVFVRALGATLLFWLLSAFLPQEKLSFLDFKKIMIAALFGVVINQLSFFNGLVYTSPINSAIIMTTSPLMALPLSYWWLKEKISTRKWLGVAIGFFGALIIIIQSQKSGNASNPILGNLLIFINAASFTFFLVYVKPLMIKYSPITVLKWSFLAGSIYLSPIGFNEFSDMNLAFPIEIWWSILYVVIGITFFTFLLNLFALKQVSPNVVSAYIFTQPVLTGLLSWILEGKIMSISSIIACILIFIGLRLVSWRK